MLYFAAVTSQESAGSAESNFLLSNDDQFQSMMTDAQTKLDAVIAGRLSKADFRTWLRDAIAPWNHVGLLDESLSGMHFETAAPIPTW